MRLTLLILITLPTFLFCQTWERTFKDGIFDEVHQTTDSGYIVTGFTSNDNNSFDVYLVKTDINGDTLWSKVYGEYTASGFSVKQTKDGGFIITGYSCESFTDDSDILLIKTDSIGNTIWMNNYDGYCSEFGESVQQTTDGGFIVAGFNQCYYSGNLYRDIYIIKTDSIGDKMWRKTYDLNESDISHSIQQTIDSGYIICGMTTNDYVDADIYVIKTNINGDTIWTKTYGGNNFDSGSSVIQTVEGGYIIVGYTTSYGDGEYDVYLLKIDSSGDIIWTKTYGGNSNDGGAHIQQTYDGGYVIVGSTTSFGNGESDIYLIKTDNNGDTLWTRTIGEQLDEGATYVEQTIDGGYVICGCKYISDYDRRVLILKTDCNGILTGITEFPTNNPNRKIIKTVDLSGRDLIKPKMNQPYIEIYDDGTTKKKMKIR